MDLDLDSETQKKCEVVLVCFLVRLRMPREREGKKWTETETYKVTNQETYGQQLESE